MIFPSVGPQTGLILVLPISGVSEVDAPGFACPPAVHNRAILLVARAGDFNPEDRLQAHRGGRGALVCGGAIYNRVKTQLLTGARGRGAREIKVKWASYNPRAGEAR